MPSQLSVIGIGTTGDSYRRKWTQGAKRRAGMQWSEQDGGYSWIWIMYIRHRNVVGVELHFSREIEQRFEEATDPLEGLISVPVVGIET